MDGDLTAELERLDARCEWGADALALHRRLVERAPGELGGWIGMARCHEALGELDAATRIYAVVLRQRPADGIARRRQAELQRRLTARRHALEARTDLGAAGLREHLGDGAAGEARFGDVVFRAEAFRVLTEEAPGDVALLVGLGGALRAAADPAGAIQAYRRALALDGGASSNAAAHVGLAAVWRQLGEHDRSMLEAAEKTYIMVLEARPRDAYASVGLAAVHLDHYEHHGGGTAHLDAAERLARSVWRPGREDEGLRRVFRRLDSLRAR